VLVRPKKVITNICNVERHVRRCYKIFKDVLFFRHLVVPIICLTQILKPQKFVCVTVVRKGLVALR